MEPAYPFFLREDVSPLETVTGGEKLQTLAAAASALWDPAVEVRDHIFFDNIGCKIDGLRCPELFRSFYKDDRGRWFPRGAFASLLVPIKTFDGNIVSLQAIFQENIAGCWRKSMLGNCIVPGGGFSFGNLKDSDEVFVCWDIESAASIHNITGMTAIVVFAPSNVSSVIQRCRQHYPKCNFVIAGTRTHEGANFSRDRAFIKGYSWSGQFKVVRPNFFGLPAEGATFHDLFLQAGPKELSQQVLAFRAVTAEPSRSINRQNCSGEFDASLRNCEVPKCLSMILEARICNAEESFSVQSLIELILGLERMPSLSVDAAKRMLSGYGMKVFAQPHKRYLAVNYSSQQLLKLIGHSNEQAKFLELLKSISGVGQSRPEHMGIGTIRIIPIPLDQIIGWQADYRPEPA